jgi:Amt family ammonium transporter
MGAVILGLVVSPICIFFCSVVKNALKYDDSLDAFGIHGIGGIVGAIGTGPIGMNIMIARRPPWPAGAMAM